MEHFKLLNSTSSQKSLKKLKSQNYLIELYTNKTKSPAVPQLKLWIYPLGNKDRYSRYYAFKQDHGYRIRKYAYNGREVIQVKTIIDTDSRTFNDIINTIVTKELQKPLTFNQNDLF